MRHYGIRWSALLLLAGLLGCSSLAPKNSSGGQSGTEQSQKQDAKSGGGSSKAKSESESSALDQELKRQGDIYKEHIKHNTEQAAQHREADKKLLKQMQKDEQSVLQDRGKQIQKEQGLDNKSQGGNGTSKDESGNSQSSGGKGQAGAGAGGSATGGPGGGRGGGTGGTGGQGGGGK